MSCSPSLPGPPHARSLDAGVPLRSVQDFLRHADPRTTRRYDSHRNSLNNPTPHVLADKVLAA